MIIMSFNNEIQYQTIEYNKNSNLNQSFGQLGLYEDAIRSPPPKSEFEIYCPVSLIINNRQLIN